MAGEESGPGELAEPLQDEWPARISSTVVDGLRHCWDTQAFTDIEIKVGEVVFPCHKVFLSAISDYFLAMFTSGMRECGDQRVEIKDMSLSSATFRAVLDFYYNCDRSVIGPATAQDLLRASGLLQMTTLQAACEAWYTASLDSLTALDVWGMAESLQCEGLALKAKEFVLHHFMAMCGSPQFLQMDVYTLKELLSDDELRVWDEDCVLQAALTWISYDLVTRGRHLAGVRGCLREKFISEEGLERFVSFIQNTLPNIEDGADNTDSTSLTEVETEGPAPTHCRQYESMVVVLGVHRASWNQRGRVHAYSFNTGAWHILSDLRMDPGEGYASCVLDNMLYLSGVNLRSPFFTRYNPDVNKWEERHGLPQRRRYHELVEVDRRIYCLCGCNHTDGVFSSVLCYNPWSNSWSNVGQLQMGVYSAAACAVGSTIFVFGGRTRGDDGSDGGGSTLRDIQAFTVPTGTSTIINRFPSPVAEARSLALQSGAMFVVLTNGVVMRVELSGEYRRHTVLPNFDRFNFGLVERNSNFLVLGGDTRYPSEHGPFSDMAEVCRRTGRVRKLDDTLVKKGKAAGCRFLLLRRKSLPQLNIPRPGSFRRHPSGRSAPGVAR